MTPMAYRSIICFSRTATCKSCAFGRSQPCYRLWRSTIRRGEGTLAGSAQIRVASISQCLGLVAKTEIPGAAARSKLMFGFLIRISALNAITGPSLSCVPPRRFIAPQLAAAPCTTRALDFYGAQCGNDSNYDSLYVFNSTAAPS